MGHVAEPAGDAPVIVFAGGGASAALGVIALLRATTWLRLRYSVVLVDEGGRHARGAGYPADDPRPLDTPVKDLSALPDQPCHLMEWARRNGSPAECGPTTLLPARVYGDYLAATLAGTAAWAAPYATVDARTGRVARAGCAGGRLAVHLAGGRRIRADAAVVATGDPAVSAPPEVPDVADGPPAGLVTCPRGTVVGPECGGTRRLFALGPARHGHPAATIPDIRDQAERMAQCVADTILRGPASRG